MDTASRKFVRERAGDQCEYCQMPAWALEAALHIEHVLARQHGGGDEVANLALACDRCNFHKGPNISGIDPDSGDIVPLFHPRRDAWNDHFRWKNCSVDGLTATGRATVRLLQMNASRRLELRRATGIGRSTGSGADSR